MASIAPRIKFCGITSLDDAQLAVDAGAWAIGLIMWEGSPRRCELPEAERIVAALRRRVEIVGVFVNAPLDELIATVEWVGLSMVQLHGDEGPAYAGEVARRTGAKIVKAARVALRPDVVALGAFNTDFHLLDTYRAGVPGGTGEAFDWSLVAERRGADAPLILSGGLDPDNVVDAIVATRPFAVDVASGTESSPGVKDPVKLRAFAAAVASTVVAEEEPEVEADEPEVESAASDAPEGADARAATESEERVP